jgi:hypothetical protein
MNTEPLAERAAYAADIAASLADLMADRQSVALALRFAALECALIAVRSGYSDDTED